MSAPAGDEAKTPQQLLETAKAALERARADNIEGYRALKALLPHVNNARTRGQINQQIWECECRGGQRPQFFSQAGQDSWLDTNVFRGKRDGVFVEIGGYDGLTGSNCLFFEMMRGWSGLMIEPSPTFFERAARFRRATCLQLALAAEAGEAEFLEVQEGFSQMSGLTASYDAKLRETVEADPRHKGVLIRVETQTLEQILDAHGLSEIDYISLDVEGGEMAVLESFPFEKYRITAWTIENNTAGTEVPSLMQQNGYRLIEALGVDDVYVAGN